MIGSPSVANRPCIGRLALLGPTAALLLTTACGTPAPASASPPAATKRSGPTPVADHKTTGEAPTSYTSPHLGRDITLLPGVFPPQEAEGYVLPFMEEHAHLFAGKRVYEIGTGAGLISLYAARLGATRVVCTDISAEAIACVRKNAYDLGYAEIIEPRLVPATDMSAYSVLAPDEVFDTIISNPPYSLDLDADRNTALVDRGDLGFSIVRGLERHLAQDGVAALFYATLFYHDAMEKFARWSGYEVHGHTALGMAPWEMEPLFNMYLRRLLEAENVPVDAFRFYKEELPYASVVDNRGPLPLFVGGGDAAPAKRAYRGFLTIRRAGQAHRDGGGKPTSR